MDAPRGILRFGIYFFIGAWMFALGVVVGRGTSPVTFDTESFQERLRVIVGEIPQESPDSDKVDLDFFKTLNKPVTNDPVVAPEGSDPILDDGKAQDPDALFKENDGPIPVKVSRKLATRNRIPAATVDKQTKAVAKKSRVKKKDPSDAGSGTTPGDNKVAEPAVTGQYTIQVAAYRAFKDAVTQMSRLTEKGFTSYRTKGEAGGATWYRVRTGSFKDFQSAQAELNRLKQAKINGMIIKKDDQ